jgi:hypothetical protein
VPGTISVLMKWLIHVQCHMLCPVLDRSTKVGNIDSTCPCMDACPSVACPCQSGHTVKPRIDVLVRIKTAIDEPLRIAIAIEHQHVAGCTTLT